MDPETTTKRQVELTAEAAGVIRTVLWLSKGKPSRFPGMNMGRELNIWKELGGLYGPENVTRGLRVCREALDLHGNTAITMLFFAGGQRQHLIRRCMEYADQQALADSVPAHAGERVRKWAASLLR